MLCGLRIEDEGRLFEVFEGMTYGHIFWGRNALNSCVDTIMKEILL